MDRQGRFRVLERVRARALGPLPERGVEELAVAHAPRVLVEPVAEMERAEVVKRVRGLVPLPVGVGSALERAEPDANELLADLDVGDAVGVVGVEDDAGEGGVVRQEDADVVGGVGAGEHQVGRIEEGLEHRNGLHAVDDVGLVAVLLPGHAREGRGHAPWAEQRRLGVEGDDCHATCRVPIFWLRDSI